jgi:hypothetical protein
MKSEEAAALVGVQNTCVFVKAQDKHGGLS